jgi:hypothetical protein
VIEDISIEVTKAKKHQEKDWGKEQTIQELWDNYKRYNVCIVGNQEE